MFRRHGRRNLCHQATHCCCEGPCQRKGPAALLDMERAPAESQSKSLPRCGMAMRALLLICLLTLANGAAPHPTSPPLPTLFGNYKITEFSANTFALLSISPPALFTLQASPTSGNCSKTVVSLTPDGTPAFTKIGSSLWAISGLLLTGSGCANCCALIGSWLDSMFAEAQQLTALVVTDNVGQVTQVALNMFAPDAANSSYSGVYQKQ